MSIKLKIIVGAVALLLLAVGAAAYISPEAPVNVEAVSSSEDSITLSWGPSQPGAFQFIEARGNSVTIGWEQSRDTRSGIANYEITKDGVTASTPFARYTFKGINPHTTSFRVCVRAFNNAGQASVPTCGTFTKQ